MIAHLNHAIEGSVHIRAGNVDLEGELRVPEHATGIVIFAHGSGSSRFSPRNQFVAQVLRNAHVGTLLFDLLTAEEEREEQYTHHLRFDIGMLARRLVDTHEWLATDYAPYFPIGFFGSSTGGGAALVAASELGGEIKAVVSRGGRPDLADEALPRVVSPTLLIVGQLDEEVIKLNRAAYRELQCEKKIEIIPTASHLFEERGTLKAAADLAASWFSRHFLS